MRRAALPLLLAACSYDAGGSAQTAAPPPEIVRVAAIEADAGGAFRWASPLLARGADHPYDGPLRSHADGESLWLVGYTQDQLDACAAVPTEPIEKSILTRSEGTTLDLPPPAWSATGEWAKDRVALEPTEPLGVPLTATWLTEGVDVCSVWTHEERRADAGSGDDSGRPAFGLPFADGTARFFYEKGVMVDVDPKTLDVRPVATSTATRFAGGFVDEDQRMWLFATNGDLVRLDRAGAREVLMSNGPWQGSVELWANSTGGGDDVDALFLPETGHLWHLHGGTVEMLHELPPRPGRERIEHGGFARTAAGDVWLVCDAVTYSIRYRGGRVETAEIGSAMWGAFYTVHDSPRYGIVAGTSTGDLLRWTELGWVNLLPARESGSLINLFDFGDGLVMGSRLGFFEYFEPGLPRCTRPGDGSYGLSSRLLIGDRLVMALLPDGGRAPIVTWTMDVSPFGCGVFPGLD